jgi:outer membrane protein assembly factor BamB
MSGPRDSSRPTTFFIALFSGCLLLCGMASAAPSITLSKKSGPPTSKVLVSGSGFEPNVGVDIFFDTKDKALVVTDGKGEFHDAGIHVPRNARPSEHWFTALERNNDKGAQKPFLVQTDWRQFHFDADGTRLNPFENVLNPRTVKGIGLKWFYLTNFTVSSSPAIVNGVVYVSSDDGNIYALNARTGAKVWSHGSDSGFSSPAVANGVVYVSSSVVVALNAKTGAELWSYPAGDSLSSPVVADGMVYVGSADHRLYALNAITGAKLWNYTTGGFVGTPPAVANGVVYAGSLDHNVYALDAETGALLWSYTTDGEVLITSPVVAEGVVYVGSADDKMYALNASNGTLLWSYKTGNGIGATPAVANGIVYVASSDGNLYALNASNGGVLWTHSASLYVSSPAVANGVVYIGSLDHNVYALNANNGTVLWSYLTGRPLDYASPAIANGLVYVGSDDGKIYAFGETGSDRERHDPTQAKAASNRPEPKTLRPDVNLKAVNVRRSSSGASI